jgi:hydroxymethylbilane synthase
MNIRIGTRGSKLALWQTQFVKKELEKYFPNEIFEIHIIKTTGDQVLDTALSQIGDKGLFTKELENALLNEEVDLAVHSLKDVPSILPDGLTLASILAREDVRDVLISKNNIPLAQLPLHATIATGSLRRRAQLLHFRSDFTIVELRGNVDTRLKKFDASDWDGMILACAGVKRMNYAERIAEIISSDILLPAVGQGAIAIETRSDDIYTKEIVQKLHHADTGYSVKAERALLRRLEGGCQVPIGANASVVQNKIILAGTITSLDGKLFVRDVLSGNLNEAERIGVSLAEQLLQSGGDKILNEIRQ